MMRPSLISIVAVVAALSWGCVQETAGPHGVSAAVSAAQNDFEYPVNPPRVEVSPDAVLPNGLPYCRTGSGLVLACYSPSFVRSAYNFPSTLNGSGQTILIVDAFGSPTIRQDLALFDAAFGLPAPPSFTILCPEGGCPAFAPNNRRHDEVGWGIETSLDVQWAHAMAPGANIVLVVAPTSSGNAINVAEAAAIRLYPGSIMSQSFGIPEIFVHNNNAQIMQAHQNYEAARAAGITVLASAGDGGATNGFGTPNALFPSSDPLFVSPCTPAGYGGERVWNEPVFGSASGGAPSFLFAAPSYQSTLGLAARTTPDVSYNAAINGGVLVYYSALGPTLRFIVGGTSAGSPQWAAIVALANQLNGGPVGFINETLYKIGCSGRYGVDFHDVTAGDNRLVGTPVGFSAGTGWDDATGWGTPNVANLVHDLATPPACP